MVRTFEINTKLYSYSIFLLTLRWLEIYPENNKNSMMQPLEKPNIKVIMEFNFKQSVYKSELTLFSAHINIFEIQLANRSNNGGTIFKNKHISINSDFIEVRSVEPLSGMTSSFANNHISDTSKWHTLSSIKLQCKIDFEFSGEFEKGKFKEEIKSHIISPVVLNMNAIGFLLLEDKFCDFELIVSGKSFKVHKCILANASEIFAKMFAQNPNKNTIEIYSDPVIFQHLIEFIYGGKLPSDDVMKCVSFNLHLLAYQFKVEVLQRICASHMYPPRQNSLE